MEWTGARYADCPAVDVQTWIDAPPERVWDLVSDIHLMPSFSQELQEVSWLDGATGPAPGAAFRGRNRNDSLGEWETTSYIVEYEPPRVFGWAVQDPDRPAARWRFVCEPEAGGTRLRQWVQIGPGPSGLSLFIERMPDKEQKIVFMRLRILESAMTDTLAGIKGLAERAAAAGT